LSAAGLDKRGLLSFVFDGRYKFACFYAPTAFNTPQTMEEIFKSNDVQLFDLQNDAGEVDNLALAPEKNKELILRMNGLLNDMIAREVGVNDGRFVASLLASSAETPKPTGSPTGKPGERQRDQQR
jgi:arylsulfatase